MLMNIKEETICSNEEKKEKLEQKIFLLKMKDIWDIEDYEYYDELIKQLKELEKDLPNPKPH